MPEHPILFSASMVRAILAGQKTMTRRVVAWPSWIEDHDAGAYWLNRHPCAALHKDGRAVRRFCCPYGSPGDLLWVRETHWISNSGERDENGHPLTAYRADSEMPSWMWGGERWRPSIHMPRWASRLTLRVTDVRVERVQDITEDDIRAEGLDGSHQMTDGHGIGMGYFDGRAWFRETWDVINAKRGHGWDANPWVWVVSFERAEVDR